MKRQLIVNFDSQQAACAFSNGVAAVETFLAADNMADLSMTISSGISKSEGLWAVSISNIDQCVTVSRDGTLLKFAKTLPSETTPTLVGYANIQSAVSVLANFLV